jgi:hypothetical protein
MLTWRAVQPSIDHYNFPQKKENGSLEISETPPRIPLTTAIPREPRKYDSPGREPRVMMI